MFILHCRTVYLTSRHILANTLSFTASVFPFRALFSLPLPPKSRRAPSICIVCIICDFICLSPSKFPTPPLSRKNQSQAFLIQSHSHCPARRRLLAATTSHRKHRLADEQLWCRDYVFYCFTEFQNWDFYCTPSRRDIVGTGFLPRSA